MAIIAASLDLSATPTVRRNQCQATLAAAAFWFVTFPAIAQALSFERSATIPDVGFVDSSFAAQTLSLTDVDGDGHLDLVAVDGNSTLVKIYRGDGAGGFGGLLEIELDSLATGVVAADLLGRSRTDLVIFSNLDETVTVLFQGDTPLTFNPLVLADVGFAPAGVAVADFSQPADGLLDLAVLGEDDTGELISVHLFQNKGDGTFVPFRPASISVAGSVPNSIVAGDFSGNGHPGIAITGLSTLGYGGRLIQLTATGDGMFTNRGALSLGVEADPRTLVQADFDGDGKIDLATVDAASQTETAFLLMLGQGNGTFHVQQPSPDAIVELFPVSLATADFNRDGHPDVVTVHGAESGVGLLSMLLSKTVSGQTTLARKPVRGLELGADQQAVTTGDVNGDGRPDIAVLMDDASVRVLLNQDDPASTPTSTPTETPMPTSTLTPTPSVTRTASATPLPPSPTASATSTASSDGSGCDSSTHGGASVGWPLAALLVLMLARRRCRM